MANSISPGVLVAGWALFSLSAQAQVYDATKAIAEGGMRFSQRNRDVIRLSNSSAAGIRAGGSASYSRSSIKVGSAASDVLSELNPLYDLNSDGISGDLFVAGNEQSWTSLPNVNGGAVKSLPSQPSNVLSKGKIDPRLRDLLIALQPDQVSDQIALLETHTLTDPETGTVSRLVNFSEDFNALQLLLAGNDSGGIPYVHGSHVLELTKTGNTRLNSAHLITRQPNGPFKAWSTQADTGRSSEKQLRPIYIPYGASPSNGNFLNVSNLQASAGTRVLSRFTVLGFSDLPNPNSGKRSAISVFATNNRTVGSITVSPGQTLAQISELFGVTVSQLMQANKLLSENIDLSGLKLIVPADLSTVGYEETLEGDTPITVARRFNMDLSWLLDLNDLSDPNQLLGLGTKLLIPGRRPPGSTVLPPSKPLPPELEYSDYGAYTSYEVTYDVKGSLTPIFQRNLIDSFR